MLISWKWCRHSSLETRRCRCRGVDRLSAVQPAAFVRTSVHIVNCIHSAVDINLNICLIWSTQHTYHCSRDERMRPRMLEIWNIRRWKIVIAIRVAIHRLHFHLVVLKRQMKKSLILSSIHMSWSIANKYHHHLLISSQQLRLKTSNQLMEKHKRLRLCFNRTRMARWSRR